MFMFIQLHRSLHLFDNLQKNVNMLSFTFKILTYANIIFILSIYRCTCTIKIIFVLISAFAVDSTIF